MVRLFCDAYIGSSRVLFFAFGETTEPAVAMTDGRLAMLTLFAGRTGIFGLVKTALDFEPLSDVSDEDNNGGGRKFSASESVEPMK